MQENRFIDFNLIDGTAAQYNEGKTPLGLLPPFTLNQFAKALAFGAEKYGRQNYRKGMPWSSHIDSLMRHIEAFRDGKDFDDESGCYHLAHAMCRISFLLEYYQIYPQGDDRVQRHFEMPRVGLDIDDVLADTISHCCKRFKCDIPQWWHDHNFRQENFAKIHSDKDFWMSIPRKVDPKDLAFEPVCYITSRSIPIEWTREWLIKNDFPDVELISVGFGNSKVEAASGRCDVFIDDRFENFVELNMAGVCCYLLDAPHNQRYSVGYKRIMDLKEYLR